MKLKRLFRRVLSRAFRLSRQVLTAPEQTMPGEMSVTLDKLDNFHDRGFCGPISATDIRSNAFRADDVYYELKLRKAKVLGSGRSAS